DHVGAKPLPDDRWRAACSPLRLPRNSNTRGHREQDAGRRCEPDAPASGEGRAIVRLKEVGPPRSSCRRTSAKRLKSCSSHSPPSRATWLASALGVRERGSSTGSKTSTRGIRSLTRKLSDRPLVLVEDPLRRAGRCGFTARSLLRRLQGGSPVEQRAPLRVATEREQQ